jgi:hypothetical protein
VNFAGFVNRQKLREEEKGPRKNPAIYLYNLGFPVFKPEYILKKKMMKDFFVLHIWSIARFG